MPNQQSKSIRVKRVWNRQVRQRQQFLSILAVIAGAFFLVAAVWFLLGNRNRVETAFAFSQENVVYDKPILAIHEMEPPSLSSIPFLPKGESQPKIAISEESYNFGSIGATDMATHEFIIANLGEAPLTIHRAYTTCSCTTAEFSATVIPPGKFSMVTLRLDAGFHDVRGQTVRRGLMIENNDPANPLVEIWTQATVRNSP